MPTESEHKRYRDGYAAGQRDGAQPSGLEDEASMRRRTDDAASDAGYSDGFFQGRRDYRAEAFSGLGRVLKDVFWIPHLSRWLRRSGSA